MKCYNHFMSEINPNLIGFVEAKASTSASSPYTSPIVKNKFKIEIGDYTEQKGDNSVSHNVKMKKLTSFDSKNEAVEFARNNPGSEFIAENKDSTLPGRNEADHKKYYDVYIQQGDGK
mgnify:FL=1